MEYKIIVASFLDQNEIDLVINFKDIMYKKEMLAFYHFIQSKRKLLFSNRKEEETKRILCALYYVSKKFIEKEERLSSFPFILGGENWILFPSQ